MQYGFNKSIGYISHTIANLLGRNLIEKLNKADIYVSPQQWGVISMLSSNANQSQEQIANFMGFNKVRVKRIIDELEKDKLVVRIKSAEDKRYNRIKLTKEGELLYRRIAPLAKETINDAYNGIDEKSIVHLEELLHKICINLKEKI